MEAKSSLFSVVLLLYLVTASIHASAMHASMLFHTSLNIVTNDWMTVWQSVPGLNCMCYRKAGGNYVESCDAMKCRATLNAYFWRFTVKIRKKMWVSHFHWIFWCKWTRLHVERFDHRMAPGDPEYRRSVCRKRRRDDGAAWRLGEKRKSEQKRQRNGERISGNIVMKGWFFLLLLLRVACPDRHVNAIHR